jgi:hypothetical protein
LLGAEPARTGGAFFCRTRVYRLRARWNLLGAWRVDAAVRKKSGVPMKTVRDYLRHAEECDALAFGANSQQEREMLVHMAETWRMLAETREKQILKHRQPAAASSDAEKDKP